MMPTAHFNLRPDTESCTEAGARHESQPDRRGARAAAPLVRKDVRFEPETTF
jgi:hypothetical protein